MDHSSIENEAYGEGAGRQFAITSWAVKNRTTVMVITALIFIAGIYSYSAMPKESFPEVVTPEIYVGVPYNSSSVVDIEKLITKPLEKEINTITGVDEINSTSVPNYSTIQVKFDYNVTPTEALRKVKDAVDKAQGDVDFPKDLPAEPNIFEMNFSELMPVMNVNLSGDYSLDQLHHYAKVLEDRIEALPEINKVDIRGVPEKEVKVSVDLHKLEALQLGFGDVAMALQTENLTMSGGEVLTDGMRRAVRVVGEFEDMEMIRDIVVKNEFQKEVRLRDIATVEFDYKEADSYAREYGRPVVMLDVIKRAGENLIIASDSINAILDRARGTVLPEDLTITITNDQSDDTRVQVDELFNHIIFGVILVVGTLLFFLGLRNALFVGLAIPMSMFISFIILNAFGVTLNIMVLFSLILALGRLVDDGIVIVENIYRHMSNGEPPMVATRKAVGEVTLPIVAATTATVMVFVPLLFWPGLMGQFMKWMPITFMVSLSASLFVALVVNPALSTQFMKVERENPDARKVYRLVGIFLVVGTLLVVIGKGMDVSFLLGLGSLTILAGILGVLNLKVAVPGTRWFQDVFLPRLETRYEGFLRYALAKHHPRTFFFGTIGLLFLAFVLLGVFPPKVEFFPVNEPKYVNIFIEAPIGTDIDKTDRIARLIEAQVDSIVNVDPYMHEVEVKHPDGTVTRERRNMLINSVISQVGNGTSDPAQGVSFANTPNKARIQLSFVKYADRHGLKTNDVLLKLQKELKGYPGVIVSVDKDAAGPPTGKPINIEITGDEIEPLLAEAERLKRFMEDRNVPGVEALRVDIDRAKPEMPIHIDRAKARRLNVSTYAVADAIRTALFGKEVSTYRIEGDDDDYKIMVRLKDEQRYDVGTIMDMNITFRDMLNGQIRQVPISAVATSELGSTFSAIKRTDLKRVVTVSSNVVAGYNSNEVIAEMKEALNGYEKDARFGMAFTGQQEDQMKEMAFLGKAFLIAIFIVFLIIVWQFNSISWPMVILSTVLFSTIGVFLGLIVFRMDFIILMTMLGIISLIGVVVNNAIVLMDFAKLLFERQKEKRGLPEEAELPIDVTREMLIIAGKTRLRPVLLTAVTAVLGLLPLAVGFNLNFGTLLTELDPHIHIGGDNVIFWGPLSWAVIYGLTFATFLTLVMVPVMLLIIAKIKHRRQWKRAERKLAAARG
ncbi:MAG: efflux RND transporter permease subunit [Flavobacteriales bacterium]|nr:efflux RND transporter permease subunit [Flavobacteriales bacterium]